MWLGTYEVGTDVVTTGLRRLVDERIMARACRFCSVTRLWSRELGGRDARPHGFVSLGQGVDGVFQGRHAVENRRPNRDAG